MYSTCLLILLSSTMQAWQRQILREILVQLQNLELLISWIKWRRKVAEEQMIWLVNSVLGFIPRSWVSYSLSDKIFTVIRCQYAVIIDIDMTGCSNKCIAINFLTCQSNLSNKQWNWLNQPTCTFLISCYMYMYIVCSIIYCKMSIIVLLHVVRYKNNSRSSTLCLW